VLIVASFLACSPFLPSCCVFFFALRPLVMLLVTLVCCSLQLFLEREFAWCSFYFKLFFDVVGFSAFVSNRRCDVYCLLDTVTLLQLLG
jgi:hypothetical protein